VVVADNTAKSAISAVEGIMVYQSDVDTLFLYNGTAWVEAVDTVSLVDSAVETVKINDLAVTTGKIAASAVTSAKIADDTIVNADVNSAAAIAYSKLNLASSVTSADIVDGTIVAGDISSTYPGHQVLTTTQKNALTGVITGTMVFDSDTASLEVYNGSAWVHVVSPSAVGLTVNFPSNVTFNNQSSFALFGLAGLRSTFVKRYTSTSVLVTLSVGAVELSSGLAQQYALGMYNPTSGSVEIGRQYSFGAGTSYSTFSGSNVMWSGLAAGTYTVEPAFREFAASSSFIFRNGGYNAVSSAMSYTLLEVN